MWDSCHCTELGLLHLCCVVTRWLSPMFPGVTLCPCVTEMVNYSLFCGVAHSGNADEGVYSTVVTDGCFEQDVNSYTLEVRVCTDLSLDLKWLVLLV